MAAIGISMAQKPHTLVAGAAGAGAGAGAGYRATRRTTMKMHAAMIRNDTAWLTNKP